MTHRNISISVVLLAVSAVLVFGFNAFAGPGAGYGRGMGYGPQMNDGFRGGVGPDPFDCPALGAGPRWGRGTGFRGYGSAPNLSEAELAKMDSQRNAFFEATQEIRQTLYAKHLELRAEMAQKTPDGQKASQLQKEISGLEAQLDQQRIAHRIEMRKINPNLGGRSFGGRAAGRFGSGSGRGCWR